MGLYFSSVSGQALSSPATWPSQRTTVGEQKKQPEIADTENRAHFIGKNRKLVPWSPNGTWERQSQESESSFSALSTPTSSPTKGANSSDTHWDPRGSCSQAWASRQGILTLGCLFLGLKNMRKHFFPLQEGSALRIHQPMSLRRDRALLRGTQQVGDGESNPRSLSYWA